ncbi:hypothetical protein D3C87_2068010 [compost metagenome]
MAHVGSGHDDALFACQTATLANFEKAFDLLVDAANRLNIAELVDGAGYRNLLGNWLRRECTDKRT